MANDPESIDQSEPGDDDQLDSPDNENFIEKAPMAYFLTDEHGKFIQVNERACELLGYDRSEMLDQTVLTISSPLDSMDDFRNQFDGLESGETHEFESTHATRTGQEVPVRITTQKLSPDTEGYLQWWIQDLSEIKERERELCKTRERLQTVIETAPLAIAGIDPSGHVQVWNPAAEELFGWKREEIIGERLQTVPEDRREEHEKLRNKAVKGESVRNFETQRLTKNGDRKDVLLSTSVVQELGGENLVSLGYFQDISELKKTQENLQQALNEKSNLLREVHHRVKNNLQVIKSMLNLHERNSDKRPEAILDDCRDRIQTMALIHDMLYQSEDLTNLSFDEYVNELVATVLSLNQYSDSSTEVSLDIESNLDLPLSVAFPCGLIIHELISNACKHAFSSDGENQLWVSMKHRDNKIHLRVQDNGPGFPDDFEPDQADSLGFEILRALGEYELNGALTISSEPRTSVELTFEL